MRGHRTVSLRDCWNLAHWSVLKTSRGSPQEATKTKCAMDKLRPAAFRSQSSEPLHARSYKRQLAKQNLIEQHAHRIDVRLLGQPEDARNPGIPPFPTWRVNSRRCPQRQLNPKPAQCLLHFDRNHVKYSSHIPSFPNLSVRL